MDFEGCRRPGGVVSSAQGGPLEATLGMKLVGLVTACLFPVLRFSSHFRFFYTGTVLFLRTARTLCSQLLSRFQKFTNNVTMFGNEGEVAFLA